MILFIFLLYESQNLFIKINESNQMLMANILVHVNKKTKTLFTLIHFIVLTPKLGCHEELYKSYTFSGKQLLKKRT